MSFSGKSTYSAGASLPELAEDVSDLIAINSPHETPLLDALGDASRVARSTVHEWIEDALLPNTGLLGGITGAVADVADAAPFRPGDLLRFEGAAEVVLVREVDLDNAQLVVTRGYGGTAPATPAAGAVVHIIGNASLEGDQAAARFTTRSRQVNYTQIFSAGVSVSGSELAVRQIGLRDELAHQKNLRTRELLRDLENSVINGVAPASSPQGSDTTRRTLRGLMSFAQTNRFAPGHGGFPTDAGLTEQQLNLALRQMWKGSSGQVDTILVGGREKRAINQFVASNRRFFTSNESFKDMVSVYESDFGVCRVVLSRYVPTGCVLLLDSSRIDVLPLSGRSFAYKALAPTGDNEGGQVIGEYTLEVRNESAHGMIGGLTG